MNQQNTEFSLFALMVEQELENNGDVVLQSLWAVVADDRKLAFLSDCFEVGMEAPEAAEVFLIEVGCAVGQLIVGLGTSVARWNFLMERTRTSGRFIS